MPLGPKAPKLKGPMGTLSKGMGAAKTANGKTKREFAPTKTSARGGFKQARDTKGKFR